MYNIINHPILLYTKYTTIICTFQEKELQMVKKCGILACSRLTKQKRKGFMNIQTGHAFIYAGQSGTGRHEAAINTAKSLTGSNVADIIEVTNDRFDPSSTAKNLTVQAVRNARSDAYIKPYSDKKVYIFPEADKMNVQGQNALLKVLEEPPEYCVFILIAENANMLLPTIRSRAVVKRFFPLSCSEIEAKLKQEYDSGPVNLAALISDGSLGKARSLMEIEDLEDLYKDILFAIKGMTGKSSRNLYAAIDLFEKEKERKELVFDICEAIVRKFLLLKDEKCDTMGFSISQKAAVEFLEALQRVRQYLKSNGNYTMLITCLLTDSWEAIHGRNNRYKI